jgi:23S rRNA (uracil1939-C5)-methyltransferase
VNTVADAAILTLRIEKPAAGGRMIAHHDGRVVLVVGAIPGELVRARLERQERSLAYATVVDVIEPHAARRAVAYDPRCGGAVYGHIEPDTQRVIKAAVVADGLRRIGRLDWTADIPVDGSPERGYRMRARLHVRQGRAGFFLEGTHQVSDAMATGQLLDAAGPAIDGVTAELRHAGLRGDADLELSEDVPGEQRAIHIDFEPEARVRVRELRLTAPGVTALSCSVRGRPGEHLVGGEAFVVDTLVPVPGAAVRLRRHARAFFQGNRYLLPTLLGAVVEVCPGGSVLDLYAGVGLFGVCLAATGRHQVTAVEGHRASAADLRSNAAPYGDTIRVCESSVEQFLAERAGGRPDVLILDPPRTGMTKDAVRGAVELGAPRVVFVSCDVATFARDLRTFGEAGYTITRLRAFDLFPNTAHVEMLAVLDRSAATGD